MTAPERIAVVEPLCWGLEHVPVNAALIAMALEAFPGSHVEFFAEETHLAAVKELLEQTRAARLARVSWRHVRIPERKTRGWARFRLTQQFLRDLDSLLRPMPPTGVIFSTTDSALVVHLKWRLFGTWKGWRVVAVFHELLASLEHHGSNKGRSLWASLVLPHPRTLRYLVLSDVIRDRLQEVFPRLAEHVASIDHPSLLGDVGGGSLQHSPPPLRFGFVGGGRGAKRLLDFTRLARDLRREEPGLEFHIVGSVPPTVPREELDGFEWSDVRLPLLEYVERIRALSHVVWLGDADHYHLVASGSLVDVISLQIPVVCQRGPFVDHLFRRFGEIGFRCDTVDLVQQEIRSLVTNFSTEQDRLQRKRLALATQELAPEQCADRLRLALSEIAQAVAFSAPTQAD